METLLWLDRETKLIGEEKVNKLLSSHVMIIGCGGVGGFTCEAIARSGVGEMTIIDFDKVDITNINRQVIALHSTIGKDKVDVLRDRLLDINPSLVIHTEKTFIDENNIEEILNRYKPDFICECIDKIPSKIATIVVAKKMNIRIISSMGTGYKLSSEHLKVSDISKTSYCPLAKQIRHELKERHITKLPVLWSDEEKQTASKDIATISYIPSIAGLKIAEYTIKQLINN